MLCLTTLRQVILHLGGIPIPAILPISKVQEAFDNKGNPLDQTLVRRANAYFDELLWFTQALTTQRRKCEADGHVQANLRGPMNGPTPMAWWIT